MSARENLTGTILTNRYEVGELLGTGGFGSTFRAQDLARFNAPCVVKELLPARRNDANARRLFEREARLLSQLSNPQIPTLHAYFEEEGRFYLVQDFVNGQTLKARLQRRTRLSEPEVLQLITRLLAVLEYLHDRELPVIHRDIKPANIILGENDVPYLIDFGAVREVCSVSVDESHTSIGTAGYAPREQALGHPRPSSDLYALGATALEAISGSHPVEWHDKSTGLLDFSGRIDCSPQFERLLIGMLAELPRRFSSVAAVRDAIRREFGSVSDAPILSQSVAPVESTSTSTSFPTNDVPSRDVANAPVSASSDTRNARRIEPDVDVSTEPLAVPGTMNSPAIMPAPAAIDPPAQIVAPRVAPVAAPSFAQDANASAAKASATTDSQAKAATPASQTTRRMLVGAVVALVLILAAAWMVTCDGTSAAPSTAGSQPPQQADSLSQNQRTNAPAAGVATDTGKTRVKAATTPGDSAIRAQIKTESTPVEAQRDTALPPTQKREPATNDKVTDPAVCASISNKFTLGATLTAAEKALLSKCK